MTELEFKPLADQGYGRIPLIAEALADLETPLSLYLKLAQPYDRGTYTFLLESAVGDERFGRYSFIGLYAHALLRVKGNRTEMVTDGKVVETNEGNPLDFIATFEHRQKMALCPGLPRLRGGLAGYFGYGAVRFIEPRLADTAPPDDLQLPDIQLMLCEELAAVDNLSGKLYLIAYADPSKPEAYSRAKQRLRVLRTKLHQPVDVPITSPSVRTGTIRELDRTDYISAVFKAREYIAAGDMMQVQIGQQLVKPFRDAPLSLYRTLCSLNPLPYMYLYNFSDMQIVGVSSETPMRQEERCVPTAENDGNGADESARIVMIRLLAGTRPRDSTSERDAELVTELLNDPKEIVEHVMLIDLTRNDIGRTAEIGSAKVTDQMVTEKHSYVQHTVSSAEGRLKSGVINMDMLHATSPAGTFSGALKVCAMETIDEPEPVKRGIYGGVVGYFSFSGGMNLAIATRTGIIRDGNLHVQAAVGAVADSDPDVEQRETEHKARAVLRVAEQV